MKHLPTTAIFLFFFSFPVWGGAIPAEGHEKTETTEITDSKAEKENAHNWVKSSVNREVVALESHELKEWQNFIEKTRTCSVSGKVKTEVWYCSNHHHTKSKTSLEEVVHSAEHK